MLPRVPRMVAPGTGRAQITAYYDQCEVDYRLLWRLSGTLSMHYGFWTRATRSVREAVANESREVFAAARVGPGDRVLDAGCGVGGPALLAARARGCQVVGVTLVPGQARRAREHARAAGALPRLRWAVMDYRRTGLADGSFDAVWAIESLCYANDTDAFAREAWRLLRPGGRLVVADGFAAREDLAPGERALLDRWLRGWAIRGLATPVQLQKSLRQAGFQQVEVTDRTAQILPSARRLWLHSLYGLPLSRLGQVLGLRSAVQTANALGARAQWDAWRRGLACYALVSAERPAVRAARPTVGGERPGQRAVSRAGAAVPPSST